MANQEHIERLKQGVESWNRWREESREIQPDLREATLSRADLRGADLSRAYLSRAYLIEADLSRVDLSEATLRGADLSRANLREASLSRADLIGAYLIGADLSEASLRGADLSRVDLGRAYLIRTDLSEASLNRAYLSSTDLSEANLSGATLIGADLREADLSNAALGHTTLAKVDLRTAKGLTTIRHQRPSDIELFSVQLPQDGGAEHFLRGVGVPDAWIDFWRASTMQPIQYHSCFLSYTSKDELLAKRLYADLQAEGVRCWFAPEDMKIGDKILHRIDEAIHVQDKSLLVLSADALNSSWIEREVMLTLEKERRQKREILFPVRLDESIMDATEPWAKLLLARHIGDFTRWEAAKEYQIAFTRLLRDLKRR